MKKPMLIVLASLVATSLAATSPAFAEDPSSRPEDSGVNLLFTLTIADQSRDGEKTERSVRLLALNGRPTKLLTGWRYPIPTTSFNTSNTTGDSAAKLRLYPLNPLHASPTVRRRVAEIVARIDEEGARERQRTGRRSLGVKKILRVRPHKRPRRVEKSPKPRFHAGTKKVLKQLLDAHAEREQLAWSCHGVSETRAGILV